MENPKVNDVFGERCPDCSSRPSLWREQPKFGSRELYWMGCRVDGHVAGGTSQNAALQSWQRMVALLKFQKGALKS